MTLIPVVPREVARRDIDATIDFYLAQGAAAAALGFVDALEAAVATVGTQPSAGSPRHGHELGLPGLRTWPLAGYPYLLFYLERRDHVDLWRVLHSRRDIPASLSFDS
ncbi:MAG: type II toxin-antitoxin system RelE/ParE family toxin [Myxococcales bacterium]|nr:type II toxin-antitoxin system RelE/ParE family toxin [Myxococcales bacterium]